jgi:hypothetical protein
LTTHNTHNRQSTMPPGGIRTYDLSKRAAATLLIDLVATGTVLFTYFAVYKIKGVSTSFFIPSCPRPSSWRASH